MHASLSLFSPARFKSQEVAGFRTLSLISSLSILPSSTRSCSMAPGRLYRNYTLDEGSYDALARRSSSQTEVPNSTSATGSRRTFDSGTTRSHGHPSSAGLTTDDDGVSPYEEESAESDLHESRVAFQPPDGAKAPPPFSTDPNHQRGIATSSDSQTQDRAGTCDGHPSPSPPPTAAGRPLYSSNYEQEESRHGTLAVSQDDANNELLSTSKMPDFFSLAVFQVVLRNPAIAHQLLKFGRSRFCGEHMEFLARVNKYHLLLHEVSKAISGIYEEFFADGAPKYVNIPQVSRREW